MRSRAIDYKRKDAERILIFIRNLEFRLSSTIKEDEKELSEYIKNRIHKLAICIPQYKQKELIIETINRCSKELHKYKNVQEISLLLPQYINNWGDGTISLDNFIESLISHLQISYLSIYIPVLGSKWRMYFTPYSISSPLLAKLLVSEMEFLSLKSLLFYGSFQCPNLTKMKIKSLT